MYIALSDDYSASFLGNTHNLALSVQEAINRAAWRRLSHQYHQVIWRLGAQSITVQTFPGTTSEFEGTESNSHQTNL